VSWLLLKGGEAEGEGELGLLALGPLERGATTSAESPHRLQLIWAGLRDQALRQAAAQVLARRLAPRTRRDPPLAFLQRPLQPLATRHPRWIGSFPTPPWIFLSFIRISGWDPCGSSWSCHFHIDVLVYFFFFFFLGDMST
jgi:hypothetical protein